jgi:DNA-binding response OmpR family regulator
MKVLIVEDNMDLANLYKQFLYSAGYDALKGDIDFILLDVMLAENTSGLDLLRDLSEDEKGRHIPVAMLTNVVKEEEKKLALGLGAKEYLVKAAQKPEEVVRIVKKYTEDGKVD